MKINKQIQHCKGVLRGQVDGDKQVAMVALYKSGFKVPESVMKGIRQSATTNETRLGEAYDVYHLHDTFIEMDRHAKYKDDVEIYAHKLVASLNRFQGSNVYSVCIGASSWLFKTDTQSYTYTKCRYDAKHAADLYKFLASASVDCDMLMRVYNALLN